jgi:hypothetical protein
MTKAFSAKEKDELLKLKGVGPTVVARLEQIGIFSFEMLGSQDPLMLTKQISMMIGSTCWHNSPLARNAIKSAVELAKNREI